MEQREYFRGIPEANRRQEERSRRYHEQHRRARAETRIGENQEGTPTGRSRDDEETVKEIGAVGGRKTDGGIDETRSKESRKEGGREKITSE